MPLPIVRKPSPQVASAIRSLSDPNKERGRSAVAPVGSTPTTRSLPTSPVVQANASDFFTTPTDGTQLLYSADQWVQVVVTLRTVGPVSCGQNASQVPVQSGKGIALVTNIPVTFTLARGTRLYVASTTVSRLSVVITPIAATSDIVDQRQQLAALLDISASLKALVARGHL